MIERFNFYDLYGYLIPGIVLVIIAFVPLPIIGRDLSSPTGEASVVIAAVVIAYLFGYFMQSMATNAIPSSFHGQFPSTWLLDRSNDTISPPVKQRIAANARKLFDLDLGIDRDADEALAKIRNDAFMLSRTIVNPKESISYAEQFQGLYSMMRGLAIDFGFGFFYMVGWALAIVDRPPIHLIADLLLVVTLLLTLLLSFVRFRQDSRNKKRIASVDKASLIAIALVFMSGGYLLGACIVTKSSDFVLWIVAISYLAAAFRFYVSYESFSIHFAQAVWRNLASKGGTNYPAVT